MLPWLDRLGIIQCQFAAGASSTPRPRFSLALADRHLNELMNCSTSHRIARNEHRRAPPYCNRCSCGAIRLFACMAHMPAASATEHSICRKNKRPPVASASPPQNCASSSVVGPTFANQCHQSPNGRAAEPINAFATRSRPSKPKPSKHASANRSIFAPSATTSPRSPISLDHPLV
jgi:hypothetical protein